MFTVASFRGRGALCTITVALAVFSAVLVSDAQQQWTPSGKPPTATSVPDVTPGAKDAGSAVEVVVINPYRSANVGSLVWGEIRKFEFDEGDAIQAGQVVCEIDPQRYVLTVQRAEERLRGLEVALKRADEEARIKKELLEVDATTRQEALRTEAEAEVARHRVAEAKKELELARFDLDSCKVKAPFSGHLAVRYKQPDETAERLERIFSIVDSSKVYAVANVPEGQLGLFPKGARAHFVSSGGKSFEGVVDKVGKLIDPRSRTKRVYLLIDNPGKELEIGMTGTLRAPQ